MDPAQQAIWKDALDARKRSLTAPKYADIFAVIEQADFRQHLEGKVSAYRKRKSMKIFASTQKITTLLDSFSRAISTLVSSHPDVAALIWGSVQVLLRIATQFAKTFETILLMLEDLLETMPQFSEYLSLFSTDQQLQDILHNVYEKYIDFCIQTIDFLHKRPLRHLFRMLFSPVRESFDRCREDIAAQKDRYRRRLEYLSRHMALQTNETSRRIESVLPQLSVSSQPQFPIFEVPFCRNASFTSRRDVLSKLHLNLTSTSGTARQTSCVLRGIGGIGKTQVALEYCYRYQAHYKLIYWLAAENGPSADIAFGKLAKPLCLVTIENANDLAARTQRIMDWLKSNNGWLLLLDNVEDYLVAQRFMPPCMHGSILMTSQKPELVHMATSEILLPSFGPLEGRELLFNIRQLSAQPTRSDEQAAEDLVKEVGGLPMAIAHLASHISQSQSDIADFLAKFQMRSPAAGIWESTSTTSTYQTSKTLETIFDMGLQSITADAKSLLLILAFLDPDRISEEILALIKPDPKFDFLGHSGTFKFDSLIKDLNGWHLVHRERKALTIHRSLKRSLLHKLDKDPVQRQVTFEQALALIVKKVPPQSEIEVAEQQKWPTHETYLPHVLSLLAIYLDSAGMSPPIDEHPDFAELLSNVGRYLADKGASNDAMPLLELAVKLYTSLDPQLTSPNHSKVLSTLSFIYSWRGISGRAQADSYSKRSLDIRLNHWKRTPDDQRTKTDKLLLSNAWEDHASNCLEQEHFDQAEPFIQKSLALKRQCGTEADYPYEFAVSYCDLALVRRAQGNKLECLNNLSRAQTLLEMQPDANKAIIENLRLVQAAQLFSLGEPAASLSAAEAVYAVLTGHGANPQSLTYMACEYLLATLHHRSGDLIKAEQCLQRALERSKTCKWPEEWIAKAKHLLSLIYTEQGRVHEADTMRLAATECSDRLLTGLRLPSARSSQDLSSTFDYMVNVYFRTLHHYPVTGK